MVHAHNVCRKNISCECSQCISFGHHHSGLLEYYSHNKTGAAANVLWITSALYKQQIQILQKCPQISGGERERDSDSDNTFEYYFPASQLRGNSANISHFFPKFSAKSNFPFKSSKCPHWRFCEWINYQSVATSRKIFYVLSKKAIFPSNKCEKKIFNNWLFCIKFFLHVATLW